MSKCAADTFKQETGLLESAEPVSMVRGISNGRVRVDCACPSLPSKVNKMSDHVVPHFHNDAGVSVIEIGSQEFMCVGANPPFDHPHVFLDLGNDNEIICPYCSTLYRFAADLAAGEARPPECVLKDKVA